MTRTPWIGLAALIAMLVLPYLPNWLFEGPRTVKHRPRRHVCGDCNAPWTAGHTCLPADEVPPRPLRGQVRRLDSPADPAVTAVHALSARRKVEKRVPRVAVDRPVDPHRRRSRERPRRFVPPPIG
jgi:hypothetical protein